MKIYEQITPETWTKGRSARDKNDFPAEINSPTACKWCLAGWLNKVYVDPNKLDFTVFSNCTVKLTKYLRDVNPNCLSFIQWNDDLERTFEEVKDLLVKADL